MRGRLILATMAFVAMIALITSCFGAVSACTFANGHENISYELSAQDYAGREGVLKAGEQAVFAIRGGPVDVFIFNEQQYYSYCAVGRDTAGWTGSAAFKCLGTSSTDFVFTAPADGNYILVLDNTMAGADPGESAKSVSLDVVYPFGNADNSPLGFTLPMIIVGIVAFMLLVATVFSRE